MKDIVFLPNSEELGIRLNEEDLLRETDHSGSNIIDQTITDTDCLESLFNGGVFKDSKFVGVVFQSCEFTESRFTGCTFENVNFNRSDFVLNEIEECTFINCSFNNAEWREAYIKNSRFVSCEFRNTTMSLCLFVEALFDNISSENIFGRSKRYNIFHGTNIEFPTEPNKDHLEFLGRNFGIEGKERNIKYAGENHIAHMSILNFNQDLTGWEFVNSATSIVNSLIQDNKYNTQVKIKYISKLCSLWVDQNMMSGFCTAALIRDLNESARRANNHVVTLEILGLVVKMQAVLTHKISLLKQSISELGLTDSKSDIDITLTLKKTYSEEEARGYIQDLREHSLIAPEDMKIRSFRTGSTVLEISVMSAHATSFLLGIALTIKSLEIVINRISGVVLATKDLHSQLKRKGTSPAPMFYNIQGAKDELDEVSRIQNSLRRSNDSLTNIDDVGTVEVGGSTKSI